MTITYTREVANSRLGGFSSLLLKWRGSVYKLFYKEFAIYISLYSLLSICYRHIAVPEFRNYFEKLCLQFQSYTDLIPISFVLGFYVSMVVGRWWQQFMYIPWPDRLMVIITANVHGSDHRGRLIRRTLIRYLSLAEVLTYRSISTAVFKRFPTMQHVIDAGFMTRTEYKQYENMKTKNLKYFIPLVWFSNLLSKVRQEGRIYDDITYLEILKVVTVAVYVFFLSTLLSRQYLDVEKDYPGHNVDLYVPIFTICQFFFYVGWLKVAEQLINPFGEDDDDFEVNFIIDRNLEVAMLTVDEMYLSHPKLERDIYWNDPNPSIPYTAASVNHKMQAFLGSTIDMSLGEEEMQFIDQVHGDEGIENKQQLDINHNYVDNRNPTLPRPPSAHSSRMQIRSRSPKISQNLWKIFSGRAKEADAEQALLERNAGSLNGSNNSTLLLMGENSDMNDPHSSDSGDSDVGDGGGSEDEESDGNKNGRRSSLSSMNGDDDDAYEKKQAKDENPDKSPHIRKHTIEESEDRPSAKKLKSVSIFNQKLETTEPPNRELAQKPKRPNLLVFNSNKNVNSSDRFTFGKEKKSPKKKVFTAKFSKRIDFSRRIGEETEEERRNAQNRTFEQQKSTRKKSIQALQRNARRANYPGNAWLRHKNPQLVRDFARIADYASMTSGADDKPDVDSPFGSINSFATSIPSPRPLRFSYFVKRVKQGQRKHFDGNSTSSCMTSPCANDDSSPSFTFANSPPNAREESAVNMPFTENLRRQLLVVHSMNTPGSSTAPSPVLGRSFGYSSSSIYPQSEDTGLVSTPQSHHGIQSGTWENKLEVIGEITSSTPGKESNQVKETKTSYCDVTYQNELHQRGTKVTNDSCTGNVKAGTFVVKSPIETELLTSRRVFNSDPRISSAQDSPTSNPLIRSRSCPSVPHHVANPNYSKKEKSFETDGNANPDVSVRRPADTTAVIIQIA